MIGVFDSGAGGLSVFREIYRLLPEEKYLFFSDNAYCPYGDKSPGFIKKRCFAITDFLLGKGADIIVVACNTATGAAINALRKKYKVKFIGMEPAVKPAALSTHTGVIGVMATTGTLSGTKYLINKGKYGENVKIVESVGKGWVELVETGNWKGEDAERTVKESLQPLLDAGADNIVLGCTHYPFLAGIIRKLAGADIKLIDPAPAAARHLIYVMVQEGLLDERRATEVLAKAARLFDLSTIKDNPGVKGSEPDIELYTSGSPSALSRVFSEIFSANKEVISINI